MLFWEMPWTECQALKWNWTQKQFPAHSVTRHSVHKRAWEKRTVQIQLIPHWVKCHQRERRKMPMRDYVTATSTDWYGHWYGAGVKSAGKRHWQNQKKDTCRNHPSLKETLLCHYLTYVLLSRELKKALKIGLVDTEKPIREFIVLMHPELSCERCCASPNKSKQRAELFWSRVG